MTTQDRLDHAAGYVWEAARRWTLEASHRPDRLLLAMRAQDVVQELTEVGAVVAAAPLPRENTGPAELLDSAAELVAGVPETERPVGLGPAFAALQTLRMSASS